MPRQTLVIFSVVLLLAACSGTAIPSSANPPLSSGSGPTPPATPSKGSAKLQLSFFPNAQHAGWLIAHTKGYFADEGIDVELVSGGPTVVVPQQLGNGLVDLALGDWPEAVNASAAGVPIVFVGLVYQDDPLRFVSLKSKGRGITEPATLKGKRVGLWPGGGGGNIELSATLKKAGLTFDDITPVDQDFFIDAFLQDTVDVGNIELYFHPAAFEDVGLPYPSSFDILDPNDIGTSMPSQVIYTTKEFLANHRDVVVRILRAGIRGWKDSIADPQAAARIVLEYLPDGTSTPEAQYRSVLETNAIVLPDRLKETDLLRIDVAQLEEGLARMREFGALAGPVELRELYDVSLIDEALSR